MTTLGDDRSLVTIDRQLITQSSLLFLNLAQLKKSDYAVCNFSTNLQDMTMDEVRQRVIFDGLRLPIPIEYPETVQTIMKACWNQIPSKRPSFLLISNILTSLTFGD